MVAPNLRARASDASAATRGAVIHLCVLRARRCLATTASGRARLVVVDDRGGVIRDDVVVALDAGAGDAGERGEKRAERAVVGFWQTFAERASEARRRHFDGRKTIDGKSSERK